MFFKLTLQTTIGKSYAPPVLTRGGTTIGAIRSEALNAPFRKYTPDDWHRRNQGTVYRRVPFKMVGIYRYRNRKGGINS